MVNLVPIPNHVHFRVSVYVLSKLKLFLFWQGILMPVVIDYLIISLYASR